MRVRLTTVIWGKDFVDTFLRLTVRSLLAPGNVPGLTDSCTVAYTIYTTAQDAELIRGSPLFGKLCDVVAVDFALFSTGEIDAAHFGSHSDLWQRGLELARRNGEILFFIIPDILYADGTLARWAERLREGYRAVYSPGPQVVLETVYDEIGRRFPSPEQPIVLDTGETSALLLRHMHPIPITMDRSSRRRTGHAEYDLRPVTGRGLAIRVLSSHPFCVDPSFFATLRSFNPCDHLDKLAFEPVTVASAEPLLKHVSWYYRPRQLGPADLTQLGFWWSSFSPPGCVRESAHVYDIVGRDDEVWRSGRARAAAAGAFLRAQLAAAALIARLFLGLAQGGYSSAARFLAAAAFVAVIRRRIVLRGDETLLVPHDTAWGGDDGARLWQLIGQGDAAAIAAQLRHYIFRATPGGGLVNLNGIGLEDAACDANIVGGPGVIAGLRVLAIDRLLKPEPVAAGGQAARRGRSRALVAVPAEADAGGAQLPGLWTETTRGLATRAFVPRAASTPLELEKKPAVPARVARSSTHLSHRARQVGGRVVWWVLDRNRNVARRTFLMLSTIPGLRKPAAVGERTLAFVYRHGMRAAFVRISAELKGRTPTAVGPNRDAAVLTDTAMPHYDRATVEDIDPGAALERLAAEKAKAEANGVGGAQRGTTAIDTTEAAQIAEVVRAVQLMRGLGAIEEVLAGYETFALGDLMRSAPLELVGELRRKWCGEAAQINAAARGRLLEALARHPGSSALLTELGYILRDEGDEEAALAAFATACHDTDASAAAVDARAKAAVERGEILMRRGDDEGAAAAFELAAGLAPVTSATRYRQGEALRRLGRVPEASAAFAQAMDASHPTWAFPKAGRDARDIAIDKA